MNNYDQFPKPDHYLELRMKWKEPFDELMGEIFFPGYSQMLAEENPKEWEAQFMNFVELYIGP